jgi:hypothetical protein
MIIFCITRSGVDITNAAVIVVVVVSMHEAGHPRAGVVEASKALGEESRQGGASPTNENSAITIGFPCFPNKVR